MIRRLSAWEIRWLHTWCSGDHAAHFQEDLRVCVCVCVCVCVPAYMCLCLCLCSSWNLLCFCIPCGDKKYHILVFHETDKTDSNPWLWTLKSTSSLLKELTATWRDRCVGQDLVQEWTGMMVQNPKGNFVFVLMFPFKPTQWGKVFPYHCTKF